MEVRSLTLGLPLVWPPDDAVLARAGQGLGAVATRCRAAGWAVQTTRVALPPLPAVLGWQAPARAADVAAWLARGCAAVGIDYANLGTVPAEAPAGAPTLPVAFAAVLPAALVAHETVFASVTLDAPAGVVPAMARAAADVVLALARGTPDGFGNLRFAALARCLPGVPFFPAAYHAGGPPTLTVALQAADLAVAAFDRAPSVRAAQDALVAALEREGGRLAGVIETACIEQGWRFGGLDLSLAPFPTAAASIAGALERLGLERFGAFGTLYAARCVTEALRRVRLPRCGFSGLMLPLLEDSGLAAAAAAGRVSIAALLLYAAVCGTGLDTVPLPGEVTADEIAALLLDVASLAVALDKPLTARLLPVPGKTAGEQTAYAFPYFANTTVLPVPGHAPTALLERAET
jgi:uncharacterized protein (UPF0210 family)